MKRNQLSTAYLVLLLLFSIFIFAGTALAQSQADLIGWWKMQGPVGDNQKLVKDYSGNGHDGTMGSSDSWITGGGIDFDGGSYGASGIVFKNNGADIVAGLTNKVTVSYVATWDGYIDAVNYPYDGRNSADIRILSSECPTHSHIRDHKGGTDMWCYEAFNNLDSRFIFGKVGKTWGDFIRITTTVDFTTGEYKMYVDDQLYSSATGKTGSFAGLVKFTIGRTLYAEMEGKMKDFRLYDGVLSAHEIAKLVDADYGLVLRYSFDETNGNVAQDSSGNEYDAVFSNSDRWQEQGQWGGCLSNDQAWSIFYGDVPAEAFSDIGDKVTVAWWAKNTAACDTYGNGCFFKGTNNRVNVFSSSVYKNDGLTPADHYLITRAGSNDEDGYWWWGYNNVHNDDMDQWHHIAFSMDHTTKTLTKYYDGKPFVEATLLDTDTCSGIDAFRLFCRSTGDTSGIQYWDCYHGMMDEFNIYNRVLTLGEVHRLSSKKPQFAYHPNPADGAVLPDKEMFLSWIAADGVDSQEVYFGDDYDVVNAADVSSPAFMGSFEIGKTRFSPGYLHSGRQYYWRVDEVFAGQVVKGEVWNFLTAKNNIDLYLLIGQSNMCVSADVNPEDNIPNIYIVRFDKRDGQWKLLDAGDVDGIGPAPSFAAGMIADREDTVVGIVHAAVSGTPQARWLKGGDLYEAALDRATEAMKFGTMRGVLWHQGESEAGDFTKASNYGSNLKNMINDIRSDLGISDLPFVLGKLGDFNTQAYKYLVNNGIDAAANDLSNVKVASPIGLTCWDDNIHFTSESQRIYGFRYAEKMMEMIGTRTSTADINSDGNVNWIDLGLLADGWLESCDYGDSNDINNDGYIDISDFVIMGQQWGR